MKKRATAFLLILLMIVSMMPALGAGALAAEITVDISPTSSNSPEETISIGVGDTLIINVKNTSSSNAYSFTATLSKSGVAELQNDTTGSIAAGATGQITIKGLTDGTVSIDITNGSSFNARKGTVHLTVGNGDPVLPPADETVEITPATDNPEVTASINVGETLGIIVTNPSANSAYNYTATPSSSDIISFLSDTTINIAKSGTGQFMVKGLANGTVDITIQNNNSSSTRKGIVHVTVGDGGGEEPPVGEDKTYVQVEMLEDGKNYLIVYGNTGSVSVVGNESTGSGTSTGLKAISTTVNGGKITLSAADAAKAEFTAEIKSSPSGSVSAWLEQGGKYLYTASSGGLRISSNEQTSSSNTGKLWHYKADGKNLLWYFKDTSSSDGYTDTSSTYKYYLDLSNGSFISKNVSTTSLANTETPAVYLFAEDDGTEPATVAVTGVSLNKTSIEINEGATETLTATIAPADATNKAVTWSSSDTTIATVSNGTVTGVKAGNATITVTTADGGKTATCAVTVNAPAPGEEKTYVLTDTLTAGKNYIIASTNEAGSAKLLYRNGTAAQSADVTVSDTAGKVTITTAQSGAVFTASGNGEGFTLKNDDYYFTLEYSASGTNSSELRFSTDTSTKVWSYSSYQLTCSSSQSPRYLYYSGSNTAFVATTGTNPARYVYLFVEDEGTAPATVAVTGVSLDQTTMALSVGGTGTLSATVAPEDATNKNVTWSSSDTSVATVDNSGIVTAVAVGTATITVTTEDGNKTATCDVTVTAPQEIESSVVELAKLKDSSVWLILVEAEASKGFTYKGAAMAWSSRYEAYVIAVESATKPAPAPTDFATASAAAAVDYPTAANDANGSKKVDMADVQYVYNLYSGKYETLAAAGGVDKILGADINGDGVIDSKDATPILTALRGAQA